MLRGNVCRSGNISDNMYEIVSTSALEGGGGSSDRVRAGGKIGGLCDRLNDIQYKQINRLSHQKT